MAREPAPAPLEVANCDLKNRPVAGQGDAPPVYVMLTSVYVP